ncbi:MAG: HAD-IA family hydrolase [Methanomassiliicoccales archaeon]|jgi:putative hydrolase of the HAD superfamily
MSLFLRRSKPASADSAGDPGENLMVDSLNAFYQTLLDTRKLVPGAVEMLERIRDRGLLVGLVSDVAWGLPSEYPLNDLRYFQLDGYFDDMVFSKYVGLRKPNPRIFKIALWNLDVKSADSAFIGNSLQADIKGAKGVGMLAVLKESKYYQHDDNVIPDGRVADWSEIDLLLDGHSD